MVLVSAMAFQFIRRLSSSSKSKRTLIKDLWNRTQEQNALVYGWIKSLRKHKKVSFLVINDGSCIHDLQVVLPTDDLLGKELYYGSSIGVEGTLIPRPNKLPQVELLGKSLKFHSPCLPASYPFPSERNCPYEHTRQFPHLRPRLRNVASMLRVRNKIEMLIHRYFQDLGYQHIHTPAITSSDCEGAGELFSLVTSDEDKISSSKEQDTFFGTPAYLTVSGQLHLEACAMGLGNVYTLSPAFRAEKSRPQTHLCEFSMLEVEVAFTESMDDITSVLEDSLKKIISETLECCAEDLSLFHKDGDRGKYDIIAKCATEPFLKMEYSDVIALINEKQSLLKTGPVKWGDDLNDEHEKFITAYHDNSPVLVQNFPMSLKPFYTMKNDGDEASASFDLLFPNCGEMAGGTIREHRHDILCKRLDELGLADRYKWYAELRQFGGVPHGGYGLGFDRLVKFILGLNNIRDAIPFPRAPKLCML